MTPQKPLERIAVLETAVATLREQQQQQAGDLYGQGDQPGIKTLVDRLVQQRLSTREQIVLYIMLVATVGTLLTVVVQALFS